MLSSVLFSFHTNSSEIKVLERELKNDRLVVAVLIVPLVPLITLGPKPLNPFYVLLAVFLAHNCVLLSGVLRKS